MTREQFRPLAPPHPGLIADGRGTGLGFSAVLSPKNPDGHLCAIADKLWDPACQETRLSSGPKAPGNFWTIAHKSLLRREPQPRAKARTESRAQRRVSRAGLRTAQTGTVGAQGCPRTPANTTPPPGPSVALWASRNNLRGAQCAELEV